MVPTLTLLIYPYSIIFILLISIPFLQLRTVVAENLPDDHSHHNIEKIFNVAGR